MSRFLAVSTLVLVFAAVPSFAANFGDCPELAGTYRCADPGIPEFSITDSVQGDVVFYKIDGSQYRSDGSGYCSSGVFYLPVPIADGPQMLSSYSVDASKNLVVGTDTVSFTGKIEQIDQYTCTRQ